VSKTQVVASFPILGGKTQLAPKILAESPIREGGKCIDLCAGRCNLSFQAWGMGFKFRGWVLNDPIQAKFFEAIRDVGDKVKVPPRSKEEYERQKALAQRGDQSALLLAPWMCFNGGGFGSSGPFPPRQAGGRRTQGGRRTPESYEANLRLAHKAFVEHKPRITALDWRDCLEAEQPGPDDLILIDGPYLDSTTGVYESETFIPIEIIDYLQSHPDLNWLFCEYDQPIYLHGFGEPALRQTRLVHPRNAGKQRVECVWTSESYKAHLAKTGSKVPEALHATLRDPQDYKGLTMPEVLKELRAVADKIETNRREVSAAERQRVLPLLIILKRLTKRKSGYHKALASIGLNASTVRSWFHRGFHTDEIIAMLEPEPEAKRKTEPAADDDPPEPPLSAAEECLQHADKLAAATLRGDVERARHLAAEYARARKIMLGIDSRS
jgi:hypothetical protein